MDTEVETPAWVAARTLKGRSDIEALFVRMDAPCHLEAQVEHRRDPNETHHKPYLFYRGDPNDTHLMVYRVIHPKFCECIFELEPST